MKYHSSIRRVLLLGPANFEGMLELSFDCWQFLIPFITLDLTNFLQLFAPPKGSSVEFIVFAYNLQSLIVPPSPLYFAGGC